MNFERTQSGILIDEKHLSVREALDLLRWLSEQQNALLLLSQKEVRVPAEPGHFTEWSLSDEQEMMSEDEQIACLDF